MNHFSAPVLSKSFKNYERGAANVEEIKTEKLRPSAKPAKFLSVKSVDTRFHSVKTVCEPPCILLNCLVSFCFITLVTNNLISWETLYSKCIANAL